MKKSFLKILPLILAGFLIIPQISLAAWWNPFTWKIFNKAKTPRAEVQITVPASEIEKLRAEIEELKKKSNTPAVTPSKSSSSISGATPTTVKSIEKSQFPKPTKQSATTVIKPEMPQQKIGTSGATTTVIIKATSSPNIPKVEPYKEPVYYQIPDGNGGYTNMITTDNPIKKFKDPIVFLEGTITNSKGEVKFIKGINRDSAVKQLRLKRDPIPDINLAQVAGYFATSSLLARDKVSISIFINDPNDPTMNWSCKKATGYNWIGKLENTQNHTEQFFTDENDPLYKELEKNLNPYTYFGNHISYTQVGINITCTVITPDTPLQVGRASFWDTMFVDFVR